MVVTVDISTYDVHVDGNSLGRVRSDGAWELLRKAMRKVPR